MNIKKNDRHRPTVARDWCWKYEDVVDFKKIEMQILPLMESFEWNGNRESGQEFEGHEDGRHHKGDHGSRWCELPSPIVKVIKPEIEKAIQIPIYPHTMYIWDYLKQNHLPIHIDSCSINLDNAVAGVIPICGDFKLKFYKDFSSEQPFDKCVYRPGDIVLINNTQYFHSGEVLSPSRISLHFFLDISFLEAKKSLCALLFPYIK